MGISFIISKWSWKYTTTKKYYKLNYDLIVWGIGIEKEEVIKSRIFTRNQIFLTVLSLFDIHVNFQFKKPQSPQSQRATNGD